MKQIEPIYTFEDEEVIYKVFYYENNRVKVKAIYKNKMVVLIGDNEFSTINDAKKGVTNMIRKAPLE